MASTAEMTPDSLDQQEQLFGHPKGLYVCFATELWERFSFYGMKYLLLLYLTKYHLFSDGEGLDVLGAYAGLVYALPVIGGMLADKYLGMRKAVLWGGILLCCGHILMAFEGHQAINYAAGTLLANDVELADGTILAAGTLLTEAVRVQDTAALNIFYLAIALIVVGVGFLKPNISTIVGQLYHKDDPRRDSGFTIFYMGINIGSFVATLFCGWLGETYGWGYGFGAAGIGMLIGLFTFISGQKHLCGLAEPSSPEKLTERVIGPINREWTIYLGSLVALCIIWWLVQGEPIVYATQNILLFVSMTSLILYAMFFKQPGARKGVAKALAIAAIVCGSLGVILEIPTDYLQDTLPQSLWGVLAPFYQLNSYAEVLVYIGIAAILAFIGYGFIRFNSREYSQTVVLMILIAFSVVFWALFEQSAGSMTLYADRVVERGGFTASQFGSLNALFIILLGIPFALLWTWLSKRSLEPSTPVKFALGIIQAGLGFGALVLGAQFPDDAGKVAAIWLVLAYLLHTTGELCLSPVGLSAVTKLSIPKVVSVSMGTWFLATALSETVATRLGKLANVDTHQGEVTDVGAALATYTNLFETLTIMGISIGVLLLVISPLLRKGMRDVH